MYQTKAMLKAAASAKLKRITALLKRELKYCDLFDFTVSSSYWNENYASTYINISLIVITYVGVDKFIGTKEFRCAVPNDGSFKHIHELLNSAKKTYQVKAARAHKKLQQKKKK